LDLIIEVGGADHQDKMIQHHVDTDIEEDFQFIVNSYQHLQRAVDFHSSYAGQSCNYNKGYKYEDAKIMMYYFFPNPMYNNQQFQQQFCM
jgi:hypothetical protein